MAEIRIISNMENPLFRRKEIAAEMFSVSSPQANEVERLLSEKISVPVEGIKVKRISGNFGTNLFNLIAFAYNSKEDKDKFEVEKKIAGTQPVA